MTGNTDMVKGKNEMVLRKETGRHNKIGPRQANLVLIAYASSEGSGESAHPRSLARTLRCSLIQAASQEEPSDRKLDP